VRVLLIGGSGFIGPHVANALRRAGHDIVLFHRGVHPPRDGVSAEIIGDRRRLHESARQLRDANADVVVDLVLSSGRQARDLIDVFRGATSRIVVLSSGDVYRACGLTHGLEEGPLEPLPLRESSALRSRLQTYPPAQIQMLQQVFGWIDDEYDKIPVEREILRDAALAGVVLRLPMVYGPGDPLRRFHPIEQRIADERRAILFPAGLAAWRATKGYVENVGAAIALAAVSERVSSRVFNVGEPDALSELEWAERIAREMRWTGTFRVLADDRVPPHLAPPGNPAQHWVTDTSRLRVELGFEEPISRGEAISRTVAWDRANPPSGFTPHQFDYAAEDAALAAI